MLQDLRFTVRLLAKDRGFTITALVTLAVCIGANTAMLSIVRSVLQKPLPFADSDRIVLLYNSYPNAGAPRVGSAVPDYFDRLTAVPALDEQGVFRQEGMTLGDETGAERLTSLRGTPSLFQMLRPQPLQGRLFTDGEGEPGKDHVVLLSYGFWQRKFAGAQVMGKSIRLNEETYQIVGVLPQAFTFLQNDTDVFVPASFMPDDKADNRRHSNGWQMVGRLRAGAAIDLVRQQVDALNVHNDQRFPELHQILKDAGFHTVAVFLKDDVVRDVRASLYLLWGGVLFVLVIGCVNIANLVIVRASGRAREMATRHAIGADLGRLARQLLTETIVLAAAGGVLGLLLGWWMLQSVSVLHLDQLPRGYEVSLDPIGTAAMLGITVVVGIALGLAPVLRLRRMNLNVELREESRGGTAGRRASLIRSGMATAQVAIALVVLVGAGLLFASFRSVTDSDLGFQPARVDTVTVSLPRTSYGKDPDVAGFEGRALAAVRAIPGVEAAGETTNVPFSGNVNNSVIVAEGHDMEPGESLLAPTLATVSAGYFETLGVRLNAGRFFDARDTAEAPKAVIVDDRMARTFWPGRDAIGRRLYFPTDRKDIAKITPDTKFLTVVGVIKEIQMLDPRKDITPVGMVFFPSQQSPQQTFTIMARMASGGGAAAAIRTALARLDPQVPVFRPRTMNAWIDQALVGRRVPMLIAVAFGGVALFLSAVGVYGVLAYGVVQRRRELGVRLALGGTAGRVFTLVLGGGLKIVGVGLIVGLVGSYFVGQLMRNQLVNVTPASPVVLALVSLILVTVAVMASLVPAWRASRINPIVVLSR